MSKYLMDDIPMTNVDLQVGLRQIKIEQEEVKVNFPNDNSFYLFTHETKDDEGEKGYQVFVQEHLPDILGFKLCLFKETSAGHTGYVDFLGLDKEGKIFLIEVKKKYHDESRGKFDVIFQSIKYYIEPQSIRTELFGKGGQTFNKEKDIESKFIEIFPEKKNIIADIEKNVLNNLENYAINVLIVIDRATPQLISTAYTILLRNTQSECRVLEMTPIKIGKEVYIYYRKYFSNNRWVDANHPNNRKSDTTMEDRLSKIEDPEIKEIFKQVVDTCSKSNFYFEPRTEGTSYFTTYAIMPNRENALLGIVFYTKQWKHGPTKRNNIPAGSIDFSNNNELKGFIYQHKLQVEEKYWRTKSGSNNFLFNLNPETVRKLGSNGIVRLINDYRNELFPT